MKLEKVIKIEQEIEKTKDKLTALRERLKELEQRKQEETNLGILRLVAEKGLSFEDLALLLQDGKDKAYDSLSASYSYGGEDMEVEA